MKKNIGLKSFGISLTISCLLFSFCLQKQLGDKSKANKQNIVNQVVDYTTTATSADTLEFTLIEARTNAPLAFKEIQVNYFQMVYDGPPLSS